MKTSRITQKTLLTPREAAQQLSVSVATVYWWHAMGKIDGINISGGTLRLYAASLQEFCRRREAGQDEPAKHNKDYLKDVLDRKTLMEPDHGLSGGHQGKRR